MEKPKQTKGERLKAAIDTLKLAFADVKVELEKSIKKIQKSIEETTKGLNLDNKKNKSSKDDFTISTQCDL